MKNYWPLVVVFIFGGIAGALTYDKLRDHPTTTHTIDTVFVSVPPIVVKPDTVFVDTSDSSYADSLAAKLTATERERDEAKATLRVLVAPKSFTKSFSQVVSPEIPAISGRLEVQHNPLPIPGDFTATIHLNPLPNLHITDTIIEREPRWVKPAVVLGTATTIYLFQEKKTLSAVAVGGLTLTLTILEF